MFLYSNAWPFLILSGGSTHLEQELQTLDTIKCFFSNRNGYLSHILKNLCSLENIIINIHFVQFLLSSHISNKIRIEYFTKILEVSNFKLSLKSC